MQARDGLEGRRARAWPLGAAALGSALSLLPGCGPVCEPGETQPCVCAGAAPGAQVCVGPAEGWGSCDCGASGAGEAGGGGAGSSGAGSSGQGGPGGAGGPGPGGGGAGPGGQGGGASWSLPCPPDGLPSCPIGAPSGGLDTALVQGAIDQCAGLGGGVVDFVPDATYTAGTIVLAAGVYLRLNGATLRASGAEADFPEYPLVEWSKWPVFVGGAYLQDVGICGPGRIERLDGQPFGLELVKMMVVTGFVVRDLVIDSTKSNPAGAGFHLLVTSDDTSPSKSVYYENVTVRGRRDGGQVWGNDGIDVQNSQHVRIVGCDVSTHDDGIAIATPKPGSPGSGDLAAVAVDDVVVENTKLSSDGGPIKFGTGSTADIRNVVFRQVTVDDSPYAGIHISNVDGGTFEHLRFEDVTIGSKVGATFMCGGGASGLCDVVDCVGARTPEVTPGAIRDVTFDGLTVNAAGPDSASCGEASLNSMERVTLKGLKLVGGETPLLRLRDICGASISDFASDASGDPTKDLDIASSVTNLVLDGSPPVCD